MTTRSKDPLLSVAQVCELQPGDEQNATWINPGFTGVVRKVDQRPTKKGGKIWPCVIADTTGSATIEVTLFTAPKFAVGDQIDICGQGLRRTEYNGNPQAALGKNTEIHVVGARVAHHEQAQAPARGEALPDGDFHKAMKRQALLMAHCWVYARKVRSKLIDEASFKDDELGVEPVQKIASGLYIEANRAGLASVVPVLGATAPAGGRADPIRFSSKPPPGPDGAAFSNHADEEEDVPF